MMGSFLPLRIGPNASTLYCITQQSPGTEESFVNGSQGPPLTAEHRFLGHIAPIRILAREIQNLNHG